MSKIDFFYEETDFNLLKVTKVKTWLKTIIREENFQLESLNYIFCSDTYLHSINVEYLKHDTLTDIITFDYTEGTKLAGDIYISVDRVGENAHLYKVDFDQELKRVMAHGVLHMMGYGDKSSEEKKLMRLKEDSYLSLQL